MFGENFVRENFLSTARKRVIENKLVFWGPSRKTLLLVGFSRYRKFEVFNAFSNYIRMLEYLFLKKKLIINFM